MGWQGSFLPCQTGFGVLSSLASPNIRKMGHGSELHRQGTAPEVIVNCVYRG